MTTTIEVGMLGLGTVGSGVVSRLQQAATQIEQTQGLRLHLAAVAVNHLAAPRAVTLPLGTRLTDSIQAVVTDPKIQLVIEVMGTLEVAEQAIATALKHGKSVITANKDLIATAGDRLIAVAQRQHCDLFYEASVAGGIPILRTLTDSYATDQVTALAGIINGTANYMLSAMTAGQTYAQALAAAQTAGYAEADPTNDVLGLDTAYKLMILSRFAFGQGPTLPTLQPTGITQLTPTICQQAARSGWQVKLLAQAQPANGQLYCRVAPVAVPSQQALSQVGGVQNGVAVTSRAIGASLYTGPGAGSTATANSVLNDVIVAAHNLIHQTAGVAFNRQRQCLPVANFNQLSQAYLLFSSDSEHAWQRLALTQQVKLRRQTTNCYQTGILTPDQAQVLRANGAQLVPIMGTVTWAKSAAVKPLVVAADIAI
ncbi:homoserine dehydrogenase [Lactiplantibacillus daowaiensis]|uniref:Homoserine dehydrogenase n=1 Tax=Lactiplantibacillus daowaiensis TaxID=2559918 RepID=A0ABW1S2T3_9LACO|nr:homoserine dehydrogenase [Lactiplantibacillus daowaiensis]